MIYLLACHRILEISLYMSWNEKYWQLLLYRLLSLNALEDVHSQGWEIWLKHPVGSAETEDYTTPSGEAILDPAAPSM